MRREPDPSANNSNCSAQAIGLVFATTTQQTTTPIVLVLKLKLKLKLVLMLMLMLVLVLETTVRVGAAQKDSRASLAAWAAVADNDRWSAPRLDVQSSGEIRIGVSGTGGTTCQQCSDLSGISSD